MTPFIPYNAFISIFYTSIKAKSKETSDGKSASTLSKQTCYSSLLFAVLSGTIDEAPVFQQLTLMIPEDFSSEAPNL